MPIFASTTTSGYSDPMRALSIKALEQRMKDMQTQQASQQAGMFTPENTQTPIQGFGQVANVLADKFNQGRADAATAAGRNELAGVIAQGPQGPNGEWSPQQQSVMSRRSPEDLTKIWEQMHQNKQNVRTESGLNTRNTATIAGENERNTANIAGRAANVAAEQAGATGRTAATLGSEEERQRLRLSADAEGQASKQEHETNQMRLKADLDKAYQERDQAHQGGMFDKKTAAEEKITRLTDELRSNEARRTETFQNSQLNQRLAQDEKLQGLQREATRANLQATIAATAGENDKKLEAEKRLQEIKIAADARKQEITNEHQAKMQTQAESATSKDLGTKIASNEKIAADEAAEKAKALASDPKRNEAIRSAETDYRKGLSHIDNLEEATKILQHPKGIYTGAMQSAAPIAGGIPGVGGMLVDKEKAQRTARFNTIVGEDAIRDMATTLKGSSTNYEMGEFKKMKNDPNISDADRARQLQKVVKAARADLEAQAKETQRIGGDTGRVDKAMRGDGGDAPPASTAGDVPRPAGKTDSDLIAEAKAAIAAGKPQAAVDAQLQKWLMGK